MVLYPNDIEKKGSSNEDMCQIIFNIIWTRRFFKVFHTYTYQENKPLQPWTPTFENSNCDKRHPPMGYQSMWKSSQLLGNSVV